MIKYVNKIFLKGEKMPKFKVHSPFDPSGGQPEVIEKLSNSILNKSPHLWKCVFHELKCLHEQKTAVRDNRRFSSQFTGASAIARNSFAPRAGLNATQMHSLQTSLDACSAVSSPLRIRST